LPILRSSTDQQVQANRVTASTLRLERVVDELEASLRGFVLTRNDKIRDDWNRARSAGPKQSEPRPHQSRRPAYTNASNGKNDRKPK